MRKRKKKRLNETPGGLFSHPVPALGVFLFILIWNVMIFVLLRPDCDLISFSSEQVHWHAETGHPSGIVLKAKYFAKTSIMHYQGEYQFNGKKYSFRCRGSKLNSFKVQDEVRMELYRNNPFYARIQGTVVHDSMFWPEKNFRLYLIFGGVGLFFFLGIIPPFISTFLRYYEQKKREKERKRAGLSTTLPNRNIKRFKAFRFFLITLTLWYFLVMIAFITQTKKLSLCAVMTLFFIGFITMGWNACYSKHEKNGKDVSIKLSPGKFKVVLVVAFLFCLPFVFMIFVSPAVSIFFIGFIVMMLQIGHMYSIPDDNSRYCNFQESNHFK